MHKSQAKGYHNGSDNHHSDLFSLQMMHYVLLISYLKLNLKMVYGYIQMLGQIQVCPTTPIILNSRH